MDRPSPRLRRVLAIAARTAMWDRASREFWTEINASTCDACGLTKGRHTHDCKRSGDDDCPF